MRFRDDPNGPFQPYLREQQHHGDHRIWGWILFFFVVTLVIAGITWLVLRMIGPRLAPAPAAAAGPDDAVLEVVRMRYAQGEIDRRTFLRLAADLGGPGPPEPPPPATA